MIAANLSFAGGVSGRDVASRYRSGVSASIDARSFRIVRASASKSDSR
jgi:hypothetical protein